MSTPTAAWPTHTLTSSLARSGWGDLSGRSMQGIRSTLRALVDLLPHGSGAGFATAAQIADAAGLSERWVRRCLHLLEDADVVRWTRGGVTMGKPGPSHFRISKRVLVALIGGARPVLAAIRAARAARTAARLEGLTFVKARGRHNRRSVHAELSDSPTPYREGRDVTVPSQKTFERLPEQAVVNARGREAVMAALKGRKRLR